MSFQSILQMGRSSRGYRSGENCFRYSGITGEIPADLAANSVLFGMLIGDANADLPGVEYIERVRLQWTTLTAFTTPIVAGRRLIVTGGSNGLPTGGTRIRPFGKSSVNYTSMFDSFGGETRIATTASLGGQTGALPALATLNLAGSGNAGDTMEAEYTFSGEDTGQLAFARNSLIQANFGLCVINPVLMDAGGTWQLVVEVDTCRLPPQYPMQSS